MRLREELITALQAEFDGDDPCETTCANAALKVFREWLGSDEVFLTIGNAMAEHGAKVRTMQDAGFVVGIDLEYAAIAGALASLTEASE
jgi:hypothetical protein